MSCCVIQDELKAMRFQDVLLKKLDDCVRDRDVGKNNAFWCVLLVHCPFFDEYLIYNCA